MGRPRDSGFSGGLECGGEKGFYGSEVGGIELVFPPVTMRAAVGDVGGDGNVLLL